MMKHATVQWIIFKGENFHKFHKLSLIHENFTLEMSTQSGFPAGHSTHDLLLKVVEDWKNVLDCDDLADAIFIEGV